MSKERLLDDVAQKPLISASRNVLLESTASSARLAGSSEIALARAKLGPTDSSKPEDPMLDLMS